MVTIEILQPGCIIEDEPNIKEEIKIEGIDPSCIEPVNMKVGTPFVITELLNLITEIKRIEQLQEKKMTVIMLRASLFMRMEICPAKH